MQNELAGIAVPLFFFLSGFLFFYKTRFTRAAYVGKLKRRSRTLLVPYLFWNALALLLTWAGQRLLPSLAIGNNVMLSQHEGIEWLKCFWVYRDNMPIYCPFWFLRDLMVVVVCSPVVYGIVKWGRGFGVAALGFLWLSGVDCSVPGISTTAFFFFTVGAWFSIFCRDFTVVFGRVRWVATVLYVVAATLSTVLWAHDATGCGGVHRVAIVAGLVAVTAWVACGVENKRLPVSDFLANSSFFIFAYHGMPIRTLYNFWTKLTQPLTEWTLLAGFFVIPALIVAIGVGAYALLRSWFPNFTRWITGGR